MRYILTERLAILAGTLVLLTAAIVVFAMFTDVPETRPLIGVIIFSLLPILAVSGLVIFYLAVRSKGFRGED